MAEARELEVVRPGALEAERWEPFGGFEGFGELSRRLDRMMDEMLGETARRPAVLEIPVDVVEADGSYVISAEIPGIARKDLAVECRDGVLTIRGEKKSERAGDREHARRLERRYGPFSRSLALPRDADPQKIAAECQNGVLRIQIEKRPETKARTIAIKG
jgi:HSP20 family protein